MGWWPQLIYASNRDTISLSLCKLPKKARPAAATCLPTYPPHQPTPFCTPPPHLHLLLHPEGLGHRQQPVGLAQRARRVPEHQRGVRQEVELHNCRGEVLRGWLGRMDGWQDLEGRSVWLALASLQQR